MIEPLPPAPAATTPSRPSELKKGQFPVGPIARVVGLLHTRSGRRAAFATLVLFALTAALVGGAFLFRATGYRHGYELGRKSVGYYESAAIADSMKVSAGNAVLESAGMLPDPNQQGSWHVARFRVTRAEKLCSFGTTQGLDTMVVATFTSQESATVGRSYYSGSDGRIHHVNR
ncbi:hypothetical protein JXD38_00130 [candidate division WOR-3 bacterium]|nr:hypothetical protein [candidate division WOR-3 bacterium]